jgi:hypothetical protein
MGQQNDWGSVPKPKTISTPRKQSVMAYQNILAVEPHPAIPGASLVRFRDGSTIPAPSSIASKFDPKLAASGATAQNATPVNDQGDPAKWFAPEQSRPDPQPVATDALPPNMTPAPSFPEPPTFAAVQPQAPLRQAPMTADPDTGLPLPVLQRIYSPRYVSGTSGYDPAKDDASRKAVRESQTEQRSGVQAWDEEARTNNLINQRMAIQSDAEAKSLAAQSELQAQHLYAADIHRQAQEERARQQALEDSWRGEQYRLDAEAKAVASREVDPGRIFRSGGTAFSMIGLAVAAALKGYATSGRDSSVADQVQRMIERDVSAQESDMTRQKGRVDNALARNAQRYGSIEAGRSALRAQQAQAALARFNVMRLDLGQNAQNAQIEADRQKLESMVYDNFEQLKSLAMGTTTTAVASAMKSPHAATSGYWRNPNDNEVAQGISQWQGIQGRGADIMGKRLTNEGKDLDNEFTRTRGMTPEQAAKADESMRTRVEHLGKGQAELSGMRNQVDQVISLAGITEDKDGTAHHKGIPGVGVGYNLAAANPLLSYLLGGKETAKAFIADFIDPRGGRIRRAGSELLTAKIKDASGAVFSDAEAERHATALGQGLSQGEDAFAQAVVDFRRALTKKELELKAGAGTDAVEQYRRDKAALSSEDAELMSAVRGRL